MDLKLTTKKTGARGTLARENYIAKRGAAGVTTTRYKTCTAKNHGDQFGIEEAMLAWSGLVTDKTLTRSCVVGCDADAFK